MKRTPTKIDSSTLPSHIGRLVDGATVYDSSCSPEARVYFIDRDGGYYLKIGGDGTLGREAEMTRYFHSKGLAPEVVDYIPLVGRDVLLTRRMGGEDCTHPLYLDNPRRLSDLIGERLRALHECDFSDCPVTDRMSEYVDLVTSNYQTGNYDTSHFPDSFGYRSAEEAWAVFSEGKSGLNSDTLIHGDYCLPNIMLDGWEFSGFIDVGNGGVGDRHVDLFWGVWTLGFNLGCDRYADRFLDAYGRDGFCPEMLRVVAAAEVFG